MYFVIMREEQCLNKFLKLESEKQYFDILKINNIHYWHYIRFSIYMIIREKVYGIPNLNTNILIEENKKNIYEIIKTIGFYRKKDVLVFNHPRRIKVGKYYKCVYTDEWLKNFSKSYYVLEEAYAGKHLQPVLTKHLKYTNNKKRDKLIKQCVKKNGKINVKEQMLGVINDIESEFQIKFSQKEICDIIKKTTDVIKNRDGYYLYYKKILKRVKPKIILCTVAYNYEKLILCELGKDMKIPVVELEHGIIGRGHVCYNFEKKIDIKSFPDYIFVFGKYDVEVPRYPINRNRIYNVGSAELEKNVKYYGKRSDNNIKNKKIITVISANDEKLLKMVCTLSRIIDLNKYHIIIKLHPSEYKKWKKFYPFLIGKDITIADDKYHNIYYYLAKSDYIIGSSSTALFEATAFKNNILIYTSGEYYRSLPIVEHGRATIVKSENDVKKIIEQEKDNIKNEDYFYSMNCKSRINEAINEVINTYKK